MPYNSVHCAYFSSVSTGGSSVTGHSLEDPPTITGKAFKLTRQCPDLRHNTRSSNRRTRGSIFCDLDHFCLPPLQQVIFNLVKRQTLFFSIMNEMEKLQFSITATQQPTTYNCSVLIFNSPFRAFTWYLVKPFKLFTFKWLNTLKQLNKV